MIYPLKLEGFEGQTIEVKQAFFAGPKLLINGQPAPKGTKRGQMLLHRGDGSEVIATWKSQSLGLDMPLLKLDGKAIRIVKPLKWYVWVWSALPILLVFSGGAIGGIVGFLAFSINTQIFRSSGNTILKFILSGVVSIIAALAFILLVAINFNLLSPGR